MAPLPLIRIRILSERIPIRCPNDLAPQLRIHDLEPPTGGVRPPLPDLPITQLYEAGTRLVVTKEAEEEAKGHGVGFAFALRYFVEFGV